MTDHLAQYFAAKEEERHVWRWPIFCIDCHKTSKLSDDVYWTNGRCAHCNSIHVTDSSSNIRWLQTRGLF